jgi:hypothetical protein
MQFTVAELMGQHISNFGQRILSADDLTTRPVTLGGPGPATQIQSGQGASQQSMDNLNENLQADRETQLKTLDTLKGIFDRQQDILSRDIPSEDVRAAGRKVGDIEFTPVALDNLAEKIESLEAALKEPSEIRVVSDQRVEIDLSTLPSDVVNEVRPILEEAALKTASVVTRKALESLAANSQDSEISIAATNTAQEIN